jgi:hypothetical protein
MALPQHVKGLAADAVTQSETVRQIRLLSVNTIDAPLLTPNRGPLRVGGSARLDFLWKGDAVAVARDGMEREDGR